MKPGGGEGEHPPRISNGDGWINGLLTGAERFLNAVLGSDTPPSSSSSSSSPTSDSASSEERGSCVVSFPIHASYLAFWQGNEYE